MHISLGGIFNICEKGGGGYMHHLKNYGGLCVIPLNAFNYITSLGLYSRQCYNFVFSLLEFLEGLISHFQKLGQCDLNKNNCTKICKNKHFNLLINHQADFSEI